jgi:hypothetical protein
MASQKSSPHHHKCGVFLWRVRPSGNYRSLGGPKLLPLIDSSHALTVISVLKGLPSSPVTAIALRFGAIYWASSLYIWARKPNWTVSSIAISAIPSIGSQPSVANRSATGRVLLFRAPVFQPPFRSPVFAPRGMTSFLYFSEPAVACYMSQSSTDYLVLCKRTCICALEYCFIERYMIEKAKKEWQRINERRGALVPCANRNSVLHSNYFLSC